MNAIMWAVDYVKVYRTGVCKGIKLLSTVTFSTKAQAEEAELLLQDGVERSGSYPHGKYRVLKGTTSIRPIL